MRKPIPETVAAKMLDLAEGWAGRRVVYLGAGGGAVLRLAGAALEAAAIEDLGLAADAEHAALRRADFILAFLPPPELRVLKPLLAQLVRGGATLIAYSHGFRDWPASQEVRFEDGGHERVLRLWRNHPLPRPAPRQPAEELLKRRVWELEDRLARLEAEVCWLKGQRLGEVVP